MDRMNVYTEKSPLTANFRKKYPEQLTLPWRIFHNFVYLVGGVTFAIGSYQYFPSVSNYLVGGWLFTVGSLGFTIADGLEWWTNNRVGCFYYADYEDSYEAAVAPIFAPKSTSKGQWQRAEVGLNFFMSLTGSFTYLVGSILFIPDLNAIVSGTYTFIVGSFIIFFAQSWKIYRAGITNEHDLTNKSFQLSNYFADIWGFLVDLTAGLGGLAYVFGSVYFLPQYDIDTEITFLAAWWFQAGGILFFASGVFMTLRYFIFGKF